MPRYEVTLYRSEGEKTCQCKGQCGRECKCKTVERFVESEDYISSVSEAMEIADEVGADAFEVYESK